jgi:hypothetical protein
MAARISERAEQPLFAASAWSFRCRLRGISMLVRTLSGFIHYSFWQARLK